jgi:His-Xaa-Ser system radical SAM maturase HxsC
MLTLSTRDAQFFSLPDGPRLLRLSKNADRPVALRKSEGLLCEPSVSAEGFACTVSLRGAGPITTPSDSRPAIVLPPTFSYLGDGDIIKIDPASRSVRTLYRRSSHHNHFLMTERCNSYCLMCSQPPKSADDGWLVDEILDCIPLIDGEAKEIGITGGEPTLLGERFVDVVRKMRSYLPRTSLHILSNGRRFSDPTFAARFASVEHPDLMIGIPLYSDVSTRHDYVVQADGAYDETIRGILNLKRLRQKVEIRVVIHKQTYERLPKLAEFIARNLSFVDHVALMGLEMIGFTKANLEELWIDPFDYQDELRSAATILSRHRISVSIYNQQLCVTPPDVWEYARKSISDWKNEYMPECEGCGVKEKCGGFFSSASFRYSQHIQPVRQVQSPSATA